MGKVTSFISCSVAIFVLINNGGRGVEANPIKPGDDPNLASLYTWGHYDDVHAKRGDTGDEVYDLVDPSLSRLMKKSGHDQIKRPEFMGQQVSLPQYMRLKNIQDEVIKMDRYIKVLANTYTPEELNADPNWRELIHMHTSLSKFMPHASR